MFNKALKTELAARTAESTEYKGLIVDYPFTLL